MADIKSPKERSLNMSKIRSKDTKPEVWLRKELFASGYRYRKNANNITGHPDLWLAKYNTAIFVHGCFWHRHEGCKYAYMPKSRMEFWAEKFRKNEQRDITVLEELKTQGIKVLIVWECTIKQMTREDGRKAEVLEQMEVFLRSEESFMEI